MRSLFFLMTTILFLTQCGTKKLLIADDFSVTMEKGACFGSCPVYKIHINQKGYATFTGERFTDKIGNHGLQLNTEDFNLLANDFASANFEEFQDEYLSNITDLPLITMSYTNNAFTKTVKGKTERPQVLKDLQSNLENIAHMEGWKSLDTLIIAIPEVEVEEEEEKPKEIIIESEIIVGFKKGTIINRWMQKFKADGLSILRPLNSERKKWVFQYDSNKVSPKGLLNRIKADDGVESAEFNKKMIEPNPDSN